MVNIQIVASRRKSLDSLAIYQKKFTERNESAQLGQPLIQAQFKIGTHRIKVYTLNFFTVLSEP